MSNAFFESRMQQEWWRGAVLYEVYPRSFQDSNADGEGDLPGLTQRLEYLQELGVDGLWIGPFFRSPMKDGGYDVADYQSVDPRFGTLEDFREMLEKAHRLGLKVIIDQVYSHTSNKHPWFLESARSPSSSKADWYVWADAQPDGSPPNNWLGRFGGVAWEWGSQRRQYYLHNFIVEQPDLNLHHPEVQEAILEVARFWLKLGVDGLRLDVANFFMHDPLLRDNPPRTEEHTEVNPYYFQQHVYDRSRPENLAFLRRLRQVLDEFPERMTVAEIACDQQLERMAEYTRPGLLHTAYSFALLGPDLDGELIASAVQEASQHQAWPSWAFSNHDVKRVASRWAGDPPELSRVRMLLALLLSLRGTVFLYQGEELGLPHSEVPQERLQDPEALRFWPMHRGRDGARTPMPWDAQGEQAGFSRHEPWLPVEPAHLPRSVNLQEMQPGSPLHFSRKVIGYRRQRSSLKVGEFDLLRADRGWLEFLRSSGLEVTWCAFNLSGDRRPLQLPEGSWAAAPAIEQGRLSGARLDQEFLLEPGGFVLWENQKE